MRIHLTPDGPKKCSVDPSNPRSKGCQYGEHYDSWEKAQEASDRGMSKEHGAFKTLQKGEAEITEEYEEYYAEQDIEQWTPEAIDEFLDHEEEVYIQEQYEEYYAEQDIEQWTPEAIDEFLTYEEERVQSSGDASFKDQGPAPF